MIGLTKLNMEEVFAVTFGVAAIIGIILGIVNYFIFEHDNKENCDG